MKSIDIRVQTECNDWIGYLSVCLPTYLLAVVRQCVHVFWRSGFEGRGGIFWFESFRTLAKIARFAKLTYLALR